MPGTGKSLRPDMLRLSLAPCVRRLWFIKNKARYKKKKKRQQNRWAPDVLLYHLHFIVAFVYGTKRKAKRMILKQLINDVSVNRNTPTRARQGSRLNFCPIIDLFVRRSTSFRRSLILRTSLRRYVT